jgi:hypothetical protein
VLRAALDGAVRDGLLAKSLITDEAWTDNGHYLAQPF